MIEPREPLAQRQTIDWALVSMRNPALGLAMLGAVSETSCSSQIRAVSAEVAEVAAAASAAAAAATAAVSGLAGDVAAVEEAVAACAPLEHTHHSLGAVATVVDDDLSLGVNAPVPTASLDVTHSGVEDFPAVHIGASDGTRWFGVDWLGRVGIGLGSAVLAVPFKVGNPGESGPTARFAGVGTGGYATSSILEVESGDTVMGGFDCSGAGSGGYGMFNFFGEPGAGRYGEMSFFDRSSEGDRRVATIFVNSVDTLKGDFGLVVRPDAWSFAYGFMVKSNGQMVIGGTSPASADCALETVNGFCHQAGNLGFYGATPCAQQSIATADPSFSYTVGGVSFNFSATSGGYGFSTADEFDSCMAVIAGLQGRLNDAIGALRAYGLLAA